MANLLRRSKYVDVALVNREALTPIYNDRRSMTSCCTQSKCCVCVAELSSRLLHYFGLLIIVIIYPVTARVVGAPQMISQPVSSIFPCSPLPSVIGEL